MIGGVGVVSEVGDVMGNVVVSMADVCVVVVNVVVSGEGEFDCAWVDFKIELKNKNHANNGVILPMW